MVLDNEINSVFSRPFKVFERNFCTPCKLIFCNSIEFMKHFSLKVNLLFPIVLILFLLNTRRATAELDSVHFVPQTFCVVDPNGNLSRNQNPYSSPPENASYEVNVCYADGSEYQIQSISNISEEVYNLEIFNNRISNGTPPTIDFFWNNSWLYCPGI